MGLFLGTSFNARGGPEASSVERVGAGWIRRSGCYPLWTVRFPLVTTAWSSAPGSTEQLRGMSSTKTAIVSGPAAPDEPLSTTLATKYAFAVKTGLGLFVGGGFVTPGPISQTSMVASGLAVGGDVEKALEGVGIPSYVLDSTGVVRWINAAAEQLLGDVRGRHFTSVVAPEDSRRARELFSRKVIGASPATEATGVLVSTEGTRVAVELSAVPLRNGERVVGVFGLIEGRPDDTPTAPPHLTPRQVEVLRLLEQGRSTKQIAAELNLSTETVRNHVRRLFRALGVNSRLEAVAAVRAASSQASGKPA